MDNPQKLSIFCAGKPCFKGPGFKKLIYRFFEDFSLFLVIFGLF